MTVRTGSPCAGGLGAAAPSHKRSIAPLIFALPVAPVRVEFFPQIADPPLPPSPGIPNVELPG